MLVAHITARLLELRPGLSVIKDGDGAATTAIGWKCRLRCEALSVHAQCARPSWRPRPVYGYVTRAVLGRGVKRPAS